MFGWCGQSYDAIPNRISATLVGITITSIIFISGISFAASKGNVVETSLILAYAVFQIFHLSSRPEMYSGGILQQVLRSPGTNGHPPLPPLVLQSYATATNSARSSRPKADRVPF